MDKNQLKRLEKYASKLKELLSATAIPDKHKNRAAQYKAYLTNDYEATQKKIEAIRLSDTK